MNPIISTGSKINVMVEFVKSEAQEGRFPTRSELEEKFHMNIRGPKLSGIRDVYQLAEVKYKRDQNPFLKYEKEKRLTNICLKLFPKLGYKIVRISIHTTHHGADFILSNAKDKLIPVEIKAYHKYGKVGKVIKYKPYFTNEISQLKKYIAELNSPYGYLVTSTNRNLGKNIPQNIRILLGKDIKTLLIKYRLLGELKSLDWIRNTYVSVEKKKTVKKVQNRILKYVKEKIINGEYVSRREIDKKFRVNTRTFFSSMKEIYKKIGIDALFLAHARMGGSIDKSLIRQRLLDFCKKEFIKGHQPTYKEIQRKFHCLPKLFFPGGIREIYQLLNQEYNRKFATKLPEEKEKMKREVINFIQKEVKKGYYPTWRDITKQFKIGINNYFKKGMREIYARANIKLSQRKGLRSSRAS
ncbi:MAG: hypothetical protein QMC80_04415 [Thermoplasmatales archaeon]|nr:hypothetical protein [Thermoplasmatales archaeon]